LAFRIHFFHETIPSLFRHIISTPGPHKKQILLSPASATIASMMPALLSITLVGIWVATFSFVVSPANGQDCADPAGAVVAIMECIKVEDSECAAAGYPAEGFKKIHNGEGTDELIDRSVQTWIFIMALSDLNIEISQMENVAPNVALISYEEETVLTSGEDFGLPPSMEYPYSFTYTQTEQAYVSVDGDCKITLWNQTGSDEEQVAVDTAFADLVAEPPILCALDPSTCDEGSPTPTADSSAHSSVLSTVRLFVPLLGFALL
jgi:hypothetical protein